MLESCGVNGVATLDCIFPLISNLIYWLILFSGTVSLIIIIISGIRFITSGGEAKSVDTAKKSMTYAIMGLLLVFLAFFILNVIAYVTNVACIKNFEAAFSATPFQSCGVTVSGTTGPADIACKWICVSQDRCSGQVIAGRCDDPATICCDFSH